MDRDSCIFYIPLSSDKEKNQTLLTNILNDITNGKYPGQQQTMSDADKEKWISKRESMGTGVYEEELNISDEQRKQGYLFWQYENALDNYEVLFSVTWQNIIEMDDKYLMVTDVFEREENVYYQDDMLEYLIDQAAEVFGLSNDQKDGYAFVMDARNDVDEYEEREYWPLVQQWIKDEHRQNHSSNVSL